MKQLALALALVGLAAPALADDTRGMPQADEQEIVLTDAQLDSVSAGTARNKINFVFVQANVSKNTQVVKGNFFAAAAQINLTSQANVADVLFVASQGGGGVPAL